MHFKISKAVFESIVNQTVPFTEKKDNTQITSHVLIIADENLILKATDKEIGIKIKTEAEILKKGKATINAKKLSDIIKALQNKEIEIKKENDQIIITQENNTPIHLNTNFTDISIKSTLVPQEPELFSSTILENITFGIDFPEKEITEILNISKCKNFIKELPNKINSKVDEKGVNLSGGQKQRIALARALLFAKNKELILLDESTSSVDPKNEVEIYTNIFNTFKNTTIIASIHKMNLLKYFDTIVIFDKGKIVDSGNFDYLMNKNSEFKQSWENYIKSNG